MEDPSAFLLKIFRPAFHSVGFLFLSLFFAVLDPSLCAALGDFHYVESTASKGSFAIAKDGKIAGLYVDAADFPGVVRAAGDLKTHIERVTGKNRSKTAPASASPRILSISLAITL